MRAPLVEAAPMAPNLALRQRARAVILWANLGMIAMIVIHDADHIRQAVGWCYTIGLSVWLVNISVYLPSLVALVLRARAGRASARRPDSGAAAGATFLNGVLVGAAFSEVHLWRQTLPVWGIWNDNFFLLGVDWISWMILALTVLVGALVAAAGAYALALAWAARRCAAGEFSPG